MNTSIRWIASSLLLLVMCADGLGQRGRGRPAPAPAPQLTGRATSASLDPQFALEWGLRIALQVRVETERLEALNFDRLMWMAEEGLDVAPMLGLRHDLGRALTEIARWQGRWSALRGAPVLRWREAYLESQKGILALRSELDRLAQGLDGTCAAPYPLSGRGHADHVGQIRLRTTGLCTWSELLSLLATGAEFREYRGQRWPEWRHEDFCADAEGIIAAADAALIAAGREIARLAPQDRHAFRDHLRQLGTVRDCARAWRTTLLSDATWNVWNPNPTAERDFQALLTVVHRLAEDRVSAFRSGGFGPRTAPELCDLIARTYAAEIRQAWVEAERQSGPRPHQRPPVARQRVDWSRVHREAIAISQHATELSRVMCDPSLAIALSSRAHPFRAFRRGERDWRPIADLSRNLQVASHRLMAVAAAAEALNTRGALTAPEEHERQVTLLIDAIAKLDLVYGPRDRNGLRSVTQSYIALLRSDQGFEQGIARAEREVFPAFDRFEAAHDPFCQFLRSCGLTWNASRR